MDFHAIADKLEQIKRNRANNTKVTMLREWLTEDNEDFRIFVEMALDETMHYNINTLPPKRSTRNDTDIIEYLHYMATRQGAGKEEKQMLADLCPDEVTREMVLRILRKDLKCGAKAGLVNQAVPDMLTIFPYCGCEGWAKRDNISYPAFVQNKEDGSFADIFLRKYSVEYFTRYGNVIEFPESHIEDELREYYNGEPVVYHGEFRVMVKGKWLPRKIGNGIINKAMIKNRTMAISESELVHFICWDVIPEKDFWNKKYEKPYKERFKLIEFNKPHLHTVETKIVTSLEEAQEYALDQIADGGEGAVLKDFSAPWKDHYSPLQIKLKAGFMGDKGKRDCELRVVDWYYGKKGTKYEKCLGGLVCESEDKLLEVNIGGGFSDEQRLFLGFDKNQDPMYPPAGEIVATLNEWKGKIITAKFNEVIQDGQGNKHRLFLPEFVEDRSHEKKVANTLKEIMKA